MSMNQEYFPLFVPSTGKKVVVFGGGVIATRRIKTLSQFNFEITVVSVSITDEVKELVLKDKVKYINKRYSPGDIGDCFLVVAATNDRVVNKDIGAVATKKGIPVSVCDCKDECTVFFPAVIIDKPVVVGVVGDGISHRAVKDTANKIREVLCHED